MLPWGRLILHFRTGTHWHFRVDAAAILFPVLIPRSSVRVPFAVDQCFPEVGSFFVFTKGRIAFFVRPSAPDSMRWESLLQLLPNAPLVSGHSAFSHSDAVILFAHRVGPRGIPR